MLRITPSKSAGGAVNYFESGLAKADYYASGEQPTLGTWHGHAASLLGLEGTVKKEAFAALCYNKKPSPHHEKLNPRNSPNRKIGYDFTFSVPKSISLLHALTSDNHIREAFETSVNETMRELEQDMRTQTGQGQEKRHVKTGNLLYAQFTHLTTRPIDGMPDPHLHAHCYVMNTTWHEEQSRFQAGEFGSIVKHAPYYEAAFDARLAYKLAQLGYPIEKRGYSFEVKGLDNATLERFSRRTAQIETLAANEATQHGFITAKQKDKLGELTRDTKRPGVKSETIQQAWMARLSDQERKTLLEITTHPQQEHDTKEDIAQAALERALAHSLERKSAIGKIPLITEGLKRSYGKILPEDMHQAVKYAHETGRIYQRTIGERTLMTTDEAVKEERNMIRYIREGRGTLPPINPSYRPQADFLNEEQKAAICHMLRSSDQVTIISGGAGTGKTTLMKEVKQGIEAEGMQLLGFAPSSGASRGVMREEGFTEADTLQQLLVNKRLQATTKGQVIWIDEAGLIGNKTMNQLFEIARVQHARILLTGDIKQHSAVKAGDALRILEDRGGIQVARVNQIQRQRKNPHYKQVVAMMAEDRIAPALAKLDRMGGIIEIADPEKRVMALVNDYTEAMKEKRTALIISPTHREGQYVTQALRTALYASGTLQGEEKPFIQLKKHDLTEEQKTDASSYAKGLVIQLHQHAPGGFRKGARFTVEESEKDRLRVVNHEGKETYLPLTYASRFTVFQQDELKVAAGDRIRFTQSGKTLQDTRVHNGDIVTVKGFTPSGDIELTNGKHIAKHFGTLTHGYVSTSHSAQGKTVQRVFIVQSDMSKPASSKQQCYVSISRGKEMAKIYTDDKAALHDAVNQDGKRMTASWVVERDAMKKGREKYENNLKLREQSETLNHHGTSLKEIIR